MEDKKDAQSPILEHQTSSDVNPFKKAAYNTSSKKLIEYNEVAEHLAYEQYGDYYDMSGDKYLIILNQHRFQSTPYFNYQEYTARKGTHRDVESLQKVFKKFGFKVEAHDDLNYEQIIDNISYFCAKDHSRTSCVAIAILTHGERGGHVCAADRPYSVNDITNMLQHTQGLAGKPKLLFVQACRGTKVDEGQRIQLDGDEVSIVIPTHADCLVLYSSYEEYLSFRDTSGSWMIQALCSVFEENYQTLDILQMITLVHRTVAFRFTNVPNNRSLHNMKQMPEARYTLTKFLKFPDNST